ncbi:MAG: magnesium transporter [Gammaproteobacteria bacterium]
MTIENSRTHRHALSRALERGTMNQVRRLLNAMPPAEIAHLLESSPPRERGVLWKLVSPELDGDVLAELNEDIASEILSRMDVAAAVEMLEDIDPDDLADLLDELPEHVTREVLARLDAQDRARIEQTRNYPDDTAGGIMNTDSITVRPDITLDVVLRYLRAHGELPKAMDSLFVVNRQDEFVGVLPLSRVLVSDPEMTVREAMSTDVEPIPVDMPIREVANLFERRDFISAPVVDGNHQLVGRVTIDDIVDVIREDADHSLMAMSGLNEFEDTFGPVVPTARRRAVWLGINLVTAFIASAVVGLFTATIEQVVALAVLMPVVASMGGIAGSQTLTLVIRAQALGQVGQSNTRYLINKELGVGFLNGLLWCLVVGVVATLWFGDTKLGLVIGAALVINLVAAALSGVTLPLVLKRMHIDPALAGSVILTTITDVVGFFSFLGLAAYFYS